MELIDIINAPWAVTPIMLQEIQAIYASHVKGEKADIASIEAKLGKTLDNTRVPFKVDQGTAVIPIHGVIGKRMNLLTQISGGVSTEILQKDIQAALEDPKVSSIVLDIDSPGGTVDGTQELVDFIFNARGDKPIVAFTDGMMASAAFWIATAADSIVISSDTATVGSIGVVASHVDISKKEELAGIKTTEITAGKFKRIASQHEPLTSEGRASIQNQIDHIYGVFIKSIARNRAVSTDTVLSDMADGRLFIGSQAVDAGLVDSITTKSSLIKNLNSKTPVISLTKGVRHEVLNEETIINMIDNNINKNKKGVEQMDIKKMCKALGVEYKDGMTEKDMYVCVDKMKKDNAKLSETCEELTASSDASAALASEEGSKVAELTSQLVESNKSAKDNADRITALEKGIKIKSCNSTIATAISDGKILSKNKAVWEKMYMSNPENATELLNTLEPVVSFDEVGSDEGSTNASTGIVTDADKQVAEMMGLTEEDYKVNN